MSAESEYRCPKCGYEWEAIPPFVGCPKCSTRQPEPKLIRPVKCHFCNRPMFYSGDERHEPEVCVGIRTSSRDEADTSATLYAHVRCWNERMATK